MTNKSQLLDHIQAMEGHDVKALVLEWLTGTDGRLEDLEQMLDGEEDVQEQVLYAQFLAEDAEENPEKLVPFTSDNDRAIPFSSHAKRLSSHPVARSMVLGDRLE